MRSIKNFIITTGNRYNNTVEVEDKELIVNTEISERDHHFVNRIGTVIATPISVDTPVEVGDQLIVHHNVFRRWYDIRGTEKNGSSYIDEDKFFVTMDQVFAYNKGKGWKAAPGYCFVKPLEAREGVLELRRELFGVLVYSDDYLESQGVYEGNIVCYTPNSEYEFEVEGVKLYRVLSNGITIKYQEKEAESYRGSREGSDRVEQSC